MKEKIRKILEIVLRWMAERVLIGRKPEIIAITGSVGKSSTKEAIFSVLSKSRKFENKVWKNEGNLNEEIGAPLTILGFKRSIRWFEWPVVLIVCAIKVISYKLEVMSYPKILILELAANKLGDIKYLTSFIKPKIGVITAVGLAHTEFFGNLRNIVQEKGALVEVLPKDGRAVLNEDDPNVKAMEYRAKAQVIYYHGGKFDSDQEAARAVGKIYGLSKKEINATLKDYEPLRHRMNIIVGVKNSTIIDDTYNANPLSMQRALKKLQVASYKLQVRKGRKIAVLGDMLELGDYADTEHRKVFENAEKVANLVITVGPIFSKLKNKYHFADSTQAGEFLLKIIRRGDIILVKGSRGMRMEHAVNLLAIKS